MARKQHPSQMLRDAVDRAEDNSVLRRLSTVDLSVLDDLASYADWDSGKDAYPGVSLLARLSAAHPKTVERSLRHLRQHMLIERVGGGYRGTASVYDVDFDRIRDKAGERTGPGSKKEDRDADQVCPSCRKGEHGVP